MNNNQIAKKYPFVTRQTLSSWENGTNIPQENKISKLKKEGINVDKYIKPAIKKLTSYLSTNNTQSVTKNNVLNEVQKNQE